MSDSSPLNLNSTPQFATAEYAQKASSDVCPTCKQPISGRYYRINGALTCETCAEISRRQIPVDSHIDNINTDFGLRLPTPARY